MLCAPTAVSVVALDVVSFTVWYVTIHRMVLQKSRVHNSMSVCNTHSHTHTNTYSPINSVHMIVLSAPRALCSRCAGGAASPL